MSADAWLSGQMEWTVDCCLVGDWLTNTATRVISSRRSSGLVARSRVLIVRNGECKRSSRAIVRHRPQTAMMTFDNGTTNGEADPHTTALGGVERLEELVRDFGFETYSAILDAKAHSVAFIWLEF